MKFQGPSFIQLQNPRFDIICLNLIVSRIWDLENLKTEDLEIPAPLRWIKDQLTMDLGLKSPIINQDQ